MTIMNTNYHLFYDDLLQKWTLIHKGKLLSNKAANRLFRVMHRMLYGQDTAVNYSFCADAIAHTILLLQGILKFQNDIYHIEFDNSLHVAVFFKSSLLTSEKRSFEE